MVVKKEQIVMISDLPSLPPAFTSAHSNKNETVDNVMQLVRRETLKTN